METVRERWTDDRMDDLNHKVDVLADRMDDGFRELRAEMSKRFDKVDAQFEKVDAKFDKVDAQFDKVDAQFDKVDAQFDKVDARFETMDGRLDAMQRTMIHGFVAMTTAIVAGFGGMAGLIATQL